ncbi:MAG TPA: hypothetical protein VFF40_03580 [Acidimicrobiia bacterium]|nr:hypothetical protein [Acidimicrobiia bacterium]
MEDRLTPGLYLEMTDRAAADYARDRVPVVIGRSSATRATWWENERPDRDDLPRKLAEFSRLGVYEVDPEFIAPERPDDIAGYHFARTPRPGQGRLTGRPTIGLSLVLISPRRPEQAQALRDWGDFVHIREIAAVGVPGYSMITPYEQVGGGDPRFLHCYEIDRDDPESVFKSMTPLVSERLGGPDSDEYRTWATTPELRIMYVNTFRLEGEATP